MGIKKFLKPKNFVAPAVSEAPQKTEITESCIKILFGPKVARLAVIVMSAPTAEEKDLLDKVMSAIHINEFLLMQFVGNSREQFLEELAGYSASYLVLFGGQDKRIHQDIAHNPSKKLLVTYSLSELIHGKEPEVRSRKRETWEGLKKLQAFWQQ